MIPDYYEKDKKKALESTEMSHNFLECYSVKVPKLGTKLIISFPMKKRARTTVRAGSHAIAILINLMLNGMKCLKRNLKEDFLEFN